MVWTAFWRDRWTAGLGYVLPLDARNRYRATAICASTMLRSLDRWTVGLAQVARFLVEPHYD